MKRLPTAAFSYYGGKQRIASKIAALLPPHTVYCEPFAGGLAVLFTKGVRRTGNTHDYREVVNDHDMRLINFYRVLQDAKQSAELMRRLELTLYSRAEHKRAAEILKTGEGSPIDLAWAWYVQIEQSFANMLFTGWRTSVFGRNLAATWAKKVRHLPAIRARLADVHIECDDVLNVIARWDSPQTCFYCDPPYVGANQGHYASYTQTDFEALLAALDGCQGSFLLSCYDNPALADYPDWERFEIKAHSSASGKGQTGANRDKSRKATTEELGDRTRTELVFRVDRSHGMRDFCKEAVGRTSQLVFWEKRG